mgnify:CR=1 FL=1
MSGLAGVYAWLSGNSAPASDDDDAPEPVQPAAAAECAPRRRPRVSAETPRERRELDPGAACPDCGGTLRVVGKDVSEMLDLIAARLKVIEIARIKKSCRACERMVPSTWRSMASSRSV